MFSLLSSSLLLFALVITTGCSTLGSGGMPKQSFDTNKDIEALAQHFEQASKIIDFYNLTDKQSQRDQRNAFITGRMVLVDLRYIQFIRGLTRDRQLLDSATDFLILSLNLAGAGVVSATTKTVLASIAAGVGGTKVIIDRDFFYQKTVPALIAAMNAQRAAMRVPLIKGMQQDIDAYPFHTALVDVQAYFEAGTFMGALIAIGADAAVKEADKKQEIQRIMDRGPKYFKILNALTHTFQELKFDQLDKAWIAFAQDAEEWANRTKKPIPAKPKSVEEFQNLYTEVFPEMTPQAKSDLYEKLVEQGLIAK